MSKSGQPGDPIGALAVMVFRLNARLIETGNKLVADLGMTSASWQVIGALDLARAPLPVAHIARNMGLARQSVQRVVDGLARDGLVRFEPNRHHRRAKLVVLTAAGQTVMQSAQERQKPWADDLLIHLGQEQVAVAVDVLAHMNALLTEISTQREQQEENET